MHLGLGLHRNFLKLCSKLTILHRKYVRKREKKSIYFFPEQPKIFDVINKISIWNGYHFSHSEENADIKVHWEDCTFPSCYCNECFINSQCKSISKEDIEKLFKKLFGYNLCIDPIAFQGKCVKKNNLNAKHDGQIIECPIKDVEGNYVYQYVINNLIDSSTVEDIRIPIVKDAIPFVYLKYRKKSERFSNKNKKVKYKKVHEVLSEKEVGKLLQLCDQLRIDYCEIDAVRDYPEGKLYVVDVNHCPSGPPNHLSFFSTMNALSMLSKSFDEKFGS